MATRNQSLEISPQTPPALAVEVAPWLKAADSQVLQEKLGDLDRAYQNFFEGRAKYP